MAAIAIVGVLVSFLTLNAILGDPNQESVSFKTIRVVSSDLAEPDPEVFNSSALNPTVEVYVGSCEDVDGNGVIDDAERAVCSGIMEEESGGEESGDAAGDEAGESAGGESGDGASESGDGEASDGGDGDSGDGGESGDNQTGADAGGGTPEGA